MTAPTASRRGLIGRLYHGETSFDFVGRAKLWLAVSGLVILAGLLSLVTRGLNLGIDFEGGTSWEVPAGDVSVSEARDELDRLGLAGANVQTLGTSEGTRLRVQAEPGAVETTREVSELLADMTGSEIGDVAVTDVGPSWGDEITQKAVRALVIFLVVITLYITMRFEWKMALATLAALVHDILVTVGVYSLFGFPVTPATVIAVLTILGYSIYDGIVVFDKVDENVKTLGTSGRSTYSQTVNASLNQVLMRTLNTTITALLPILSLLVVGSLLLGAATLQEFALALLVGLGASAYSSLFIASPILAILKEREPRYASLRHRLEGGRRSPLVPTGGGDAGSGSDAEVEVEVHVEADTDGGAEPRRRRPAPPAAGPIQPRGRKKGRRR